MPSTRNLFSRLRLPLRSLHAAAATETTLSHPTVRTIRSFDTEDPELLVLRSLSRRDLDEARRLLDETQHWSSSAVVRWTSALSRYARVGFVDEARALFDLMPLRNIVTWNAMLSAYVSSGRLAAALELFRLMPERNVVSWTSTFCGLARAGRIREAREIFDVMPERNVVSWNAMIAGLAGSGDLEGARRLFDEMPERSAASWNALIAGYAERGRMVEARRLFAEMGGCANVVSWTAMIAGYCRAGDVWDAYDLFRAMTPARNVVSWTAMISGFTWNGYHEEALLLFRDMNRTSADVKPNGETVVSLIYACAGLGFSRLGKQVHAFAIANAMDGGDGRLRKGLIHMYSRFGIMDWASNVFDRGSRTRDAVCWHSMIDGYVRAGRLEEARRMFDEIATDPERLTWITMMVTWTTMVSAHFDAGDVREARSLFDRMPERDAAAWAALVSGLVRNERIAEAFEALAEMRGGAGISPADHALAALTGAAGSVARLEVGEQIHGLMTKTRPLWADTILCNALISMYAKSGDADAARRVFDGMVSRDAVSWNAAIMGMAHHGRARDALQLFDAMQREGRGEPSGGAWLGALTACAHAGMVDRGLEIVRSMVDRGSPVGPDHYACVVDMLGRAGRAGEAERFVQGVAAVEPPGVEVWGALLGTCGMGGGGGAVGVAEAAARRVMELDSGNAAAHVALCRVYAEGGGFEEEGAVRAEMRRKGVRKAPGCSWIGVKGTAHVFFVEDNCIYG